MNDFTQKKRIVIKIGSHSLVHPRTGRIDYIKMERLAMEAADISNRGLDVCLVSSGAKADIGNFRKIRFAAGKSDARFYRTGKAYVCISEIFCGI